jgi:hypothetical protein
MLVSKEIIDIEGGRIAFLDPLYKSWLKEYYFKRQWQIFSVSLPRFLTSLNEGQQKKPGNHLTFKSSGDS